MAWLCGLCGPQHDDDDAEAAEREPLLAQYDDETARQRRLHAKLHSYQMVRALGQGYLPSTAQAVANVRTLLAGLEQGQGQQLSSAGRALVRWTTRWLEQAMALAQHKNGEDQLQDFVWCLARSRVAVDVDGLVQTAERAGAASSAQATGAAQSLKTVGSLLLTNTDFRLFLADLSAVGRDVFRDTAVALSDASRVAAENVDAQKSEQQQQQQQQDDHANNNNSTATDDAMPQAQNNLADVAGEVAAGATKVAAEATQSATDKLVDNADGTRDQLLARLRQAVARLRQKPDYAQSVSLLTTLLQRYATAYVRVVEHTVEGVVEEAEQQQEAGTLAANDEVDAALRNFWSFITSFGDAAAWTELAERFHRLLDRVRGDVEGASDNNNDDRITDFIHQVSKAVQDLLTDPAFFDHVDERMDALRKQVQGLDDGPSSSSLQDDVKELLEQAKTALASVAHDKEVADLVSTTSRLVDVLWPSSSPEAAGQNAEQLLADAANVFVPLLVDAVQHVPIPRLEIATPDVDLLLENVVLEPGRTVHGSSFLPYRLHVQVRNDVDVYKGRVGGPAAGLHTAATIHVQGLSAAAEDVGYVLRLHAGPLLRLTDAGLASVHLDARGLDVQLDAAVVRDAADTVLALRGVRVRVHHLDYGVRQSRASWLLWLLKPLLRPLLRRTLEQQLAAALTAGLQGLNRELVFARERLRAARLASSGSGLQDLAAFVRAVTTRFSPPSGSGDPDTQVSVGLRSDGGGVFQGVYAPGSLLRVWDEEAGRAQDRIDTYERGGWRNDIFDVPTEGGS